MKVLVTGNRGYIGSVLTPMLLERDHDVTGLDSDLFQDCTFSGDVGRNCRLIKKDVRDASVDDLAGFDAIIHLAGLSNDPLGDYRPAITEEINFNASLRLAQLAKAGWRATLSVRLVMQHLWRSRRQFSDGRLQASRRSRLMALSKANVELAVGPMADETFSPTFLRASTAYGLSPRIRFDLVVNNLTAWAYTTGVVYLKSDGTPWRPIVHVEDIARAYIAALEADRELVHNQAFNVGLTTENYQIRDIAELVAPSCPTAA